MGIVFDQIGCLLGSDTLRVQPLTDICSGVIMRVYFMEIQDVEVGQGTASQVLHCHLLRLMAKSAEFKVDTTS